MGADKCVSLAPPHVEAKIIRGEDLREAFGEARNLQQDVVHDSVPARRRLITSNHRSASPPRRNMIVAMISKPNGNCQLIVKDESTSSRMRKTAAPATGPHTVARPPSTTMTTSSPERAHAMSAGLTNC